ncbi:Uncharacterized protein, UPF0305 family [Acetitomaculum ruminis DSM 5522]|uniref:Uncharacterized protein, UPF0305 family n=1 Tax=Acetitomaculum ruminis DSM 5522 TaxID=1120918 RepID=A0A1I0XZ54_9FIRM|nr:DUF2115 family protein [Acetitomaculum ruminis]SFB06295.1 Uncharacterized protein, UPF0305 family [Acetitomaculum ruminis DSM 5522]
MTKLELLCMLRADVDKLPIEELVSEYYDLSEKLDTESANKSVKFFNLEHIVKIRELEINRNFPDNLPSDHVLRSIDLKAEFPMKLFKEYTDTIKLYLDQFLPGTDYYKSIIWIVCAYRAFILEQPMHPQKVVRYVIKKRKIPSNNTNRITEINEYYCPSREEGQDSVCKFCPCHYLPNK